MNKIIDDKRYLVKMCYTPMGQLCLTGNELKDRPDLINRYVYLELGPITELILLTKKFFNKKR